MELRLHVTLAGLLRDLKRFRERREGSIALAGLRVNLRQQRQEVRPETANARRRPARDRLSQVGNPFFGPPFGGDRPAAKGRSPRQPRAKRQLGRE